MPEAIGLTAAHVIFGAFAVAGLVALVWLTLQILVDGVKAELSPFQHFVRSLGRRQR